FWEDKWYAGGVIKELFPRLYALELHKHVTIRMKLMAPSLDNSFGKRVRSGAEESQFNSLLEIVQVINLVPCEDRYFWSLESEGDYSVASIRKLVNEKRFQEVEKVYDSYEIFSENSITDTYSDHQNNRPVDVFRHLHGHGRSGYGSIVVELLVVVSISDTR
nr:RNA-directed DNA polymerase, eukaryota [Tanacetum cinerariifolium]